jgi:hypothetical protein
MKTKILRNIFITVGVLFASARLLSAGMNDGVLNFSQTPSAPRQPTFITFNPPGSTSTFPSAITPGRVIIGSYADASGVTHGFLRTPSGSFTTFDVPGSTSTTPTGITPGGIITGWYQGTMGGLDLHGFLRACDGSITSFDAPPGGYILGSLYTLGGPPPSVNPAGDIAGIYVDASFVEHGFLRTPHGAFTTIDFPGASYTEGLAINPAGVIVGDFCNAATCYRGFLRTPDGTFTMIGPPSDFVETIPTGGINPAGAITGTFYDGVMVHGYLRSPDGTFTSFDPPGSTYTEPFAINPAGAITGYYVDASNVPHGFLRAPNGTITTFDPPGSTGTAPLAINPGGVITGVFFDATGVAHGFVRIP